MSRRSKHIEPELGGTLTSACGVFMAGVALLLMET
jgi:hypothetical protein